MSSPLDGFNLIAIHYDRLARLVFGRSVYRSQVCFLGAVPQGGDTLILGGGSGDILKSLIEVNPSCNVWYVEASSKMIDLARKRIPAKTTATITFVHGTEKTIPEGVYFDAVISHFVLDLFPDNEVLDICRTACRKLKNGGLWLVSDFRDAKWWHKFMLWTMYRFFDVTSKVRARSLPAWEDQLRSVGMKERHARSFYHGFIKSALYQKG